MNTFTDFIAAGEHLKASGVAGDLVAMGRSAGGLLMGAALNLRPDLWKAALVGVPFVDVLSTMLDASIPLITFEYDEWGNPQGPDAYAVMRAYSPYDNLKADTYPPLFVSGGLNDPRVAYWEPAKYVARLRDLARPGSGPVVLKTNLGAGHGGSSGRYAALNETAEEYAFALAAVEGTLGTDPE
jgi:oligopeptidase B